MSREFWTVEAVSQAVRPSHQSLLNSSSIPTQTQNRLTFITFTISRLEIVRLTILASERAYETSVCVSRLLDGLVQDFLQTPDLLPKGTNHGVYSSWTPLTFLQARPVLGVQEPSLLNSLMLRSKLSDSNETSQLSDPEDPWWDSRPKQDSGTKKFIRWWLISMNKTRHWCLFGQYFGFEYKD